MMTHLQQTWSDRLYPNQVLDEVPADLGLTIAVPCYREHTVIPLLESLANCHKPDVAVEVMLVIVTSDQHSERVIQENQHTYWEAESWIKENTDVPYTLHTLHFQGVPHEIMGVDFARKLGMDEGVNRLIATRQPQGIIATLDADAEVSTNLLQTMVEAYHVDPQTVGLTASVQFRIPEQSTDQEQQLVQWIALEQRYLQEASTRAGYSLAQYSHASGLSCRAWAYRQAGGLPLNGGNGTECLWQKLALVGNVWPLREAEITIAPRFQARRPGGLGEKLEKLRNQALSSHMVLAPKAFEALRSVMYFGQSFHELHSMRQFQEALEELPYPARALLIQERVHELWRQWHTRPTQQMSGQTMWLQWFDMDRWRRAIHFWGTESFAKMAVEEVVAEWLQSLSGCEEESLHPDYLLQRLKQVHHPLQPDIHLRRA